MDSGLLLKWLCCMLTHSKSCFLESLWFLGDSIAFWAKPAFEDALQRQHWKYPALRRNKVNFLSVHGQKLERLPLYLRAKLDTLILWPKLMVIHCGSNNIQIDTDVNKLITEVSTVLMQVITMLKAANPEIKLLWSDVLPHLQYKGMTTPYGNMITNNVNACAQFCVWSQGHYFLEHPYIDTRKPAIFRHTKGVQDLVHLSDFGYHLFNMDLDLAVASLLPPNSLLEVAYSAPPAPNPLTQGPYSIK